MVAENRLFFRPLYRTPRCQRPRPTPEAYDANIRSRESASQRYAGEIGVEGFRLTMSNSYSNRIIDAVRQSTLLRFEPVRKADPYLPSVSRPGIRALLEFSLCFVISTRLKIASAGLSRHVLSFRGGRLQFHKWLGAHVFLVILPVY